MASFVRDLLNFNSIKGNVILGLVVMGIVTFSLAASNLWFSEQIQTSQISLNNDLAPTHAALEGINKEIYQASLSLNAYLETGKDTHRRNWEASWTADIQKHLGILKQFRSSTVSISTQQSILKIEKQLAELKSSQTEVNSAILAHYASNGNMDALASTDALNPYRNSLTAELSNNITAISAEISLLKSEINNRISDQQQQHTQYLDFLKISSVAAFVLCVALALIIGYYLISQIMRSLYYIKQAVKELSKGNLPESIRQSRNETSYITRELTALTNNLRNVEQFALKVGEGRFDNEINVFDNSGELGTSLASMRDSLSRVAKEDKQRNWVNEGFARFGDILRSHNSSIAELCDVTISNLVKYINANQGAIFLIEHSNEHQQEVLKMASCYAYDRKKFLNKEILKGEGISGQAWQEEDVIVINDIPQDYVSIRSGLGDANPKAIVVVPLSVNEQTQGVLELASFHEFEPYQISFIKKIAENMASAIATARNNEKTQQLLMEFQHITEQLRAQEEEMRQNMEELEATQEEMERAKFEIERKENNLNSVINNTSDTIFSLDKDYQILVVNKVLADKYSNMGINLEVGTRIYDILPKSAWEKWKPRYDRALNGEQYSVIEESSGSGGSRYSQTYHNPIIDESGQIIGVSVISRDVTDTVLAQKEAENKRFTISSLIDNTDDTYFAIDQEYRILVANKTLKARFATSNITLNEGDNIFDKLPNDQHQDWKQRYDRALAGESFVLTTERQVKDAILTIEVHHHPILDAEGKVIGATVMSKDITRWQQALLDKEVQERELSKLKQAMGIQASAKEQLLKKASEARVNEKTK